MKINENQKRMESIIVIHRNKKHCIASALGAIKKELMSLCNRPL